MLSNVRPTSFTEPAVFNGPEITMQKDNTHQNGKWEHRDMSVVLF